MKAEKLRRQAEQYRPPSFPDHHLCDADGQPVPFHRAQTYAYDSPRRTVAMIAGTQGGKTSFGPWWLAHKIQQRGSGDYLAVTSTYDLFKLKLLPEFLRVFEEKLELGRFWLGDKVFELRDPETGKFWARRSADRMWGRVILRSAQSLSGLESATVKAMWLDECGQDDFTLEARKALRRRGALYQADELLTTTLYNLGWVKQQVIDPATNGGAVSLERVELASGREAEVEVTDNAAANICLVQFDSVVNPLYPQAEFDEAQATLPDDEFQMMYRGRVTKLRTLIYNTFDPALDTCARFPIPAHWARFLGLDFGGVHTAALFYAEEPESKKLYCYREYLAGDKSAKEHATALLEGEPGRPRAVGGSRSEGQWRLEFATAGLPIGEPDQPDVWVGINRVYAQNKQHQIIYFADLTGVLDQKGRYRRKRDKAGNPTDEIENKQMFHFLDAERYIIGRIRSHTGSWTRGMSQ